QTGKPDAGPECGDCQRCKRRAQDNGGPRVFRGDSEAQELLPGGVLFDRDEQSTPPERTSRDFEVPGVELVAVSHDSASVQELLPKFSEGFLWSLPLVTPIRH